jgi:hypothetical protein
MRGYRIAEERDSFVQAKIAWCVAVERGRRCKPMLGWCLVEAQHMPSSMTSAAQR